jgi:hypothetical protein
VVRHNWKFCSKPNSRGDANVQVSFWGCRQDRGLMEGD